MKANATNPINFVKRYEDANTLLQGNAPEGAVAAHLIQLTTSSNAVGDRMGFDGQRNAVVDLIRSASVDDTRKNAVLAVTNSVLRASAKIVQEHRDLTIEAAAFHTNAKPATPSPEVARAFLSQFMEAGAKAGQKGAHDDWFVNLGPGSGKTFFDTPDPASVEKRAAEIAQKKGAPLADKHRLAAADELAKESKVKFGEAAGAAGRIFGLPYEKLEKVGGFALQKADANNAESVEAAALGLLAHLSGKDVQIDAKSSPAEYEAALKEKLGNLEELRGQLESTNGRAWAELKPREQEEATAYFGSILRELAELRLGHKSYDQLSPAAASAVTTTHDVYVHMRADWLFNDDWGKSQAVPFQQLDTKTKDADIPPFFFGLHGMVSEAERSLRMSKAS